uniref:Vesicle associated membrane protein 3 n=1 Tax=Meleagris gallopavo TaxID=9103 RepID=G1MQN9_MELGA
MLLMQKKRKTQKSKWSFGATQQKVIKAVSRVQEMHTGAPASVTVLYWVTRIWLAGVLLFCMPNAFSLCFLLLNINCFKRIGTDNRPVQEQRTTVEVPVLWSANVPGNTNVPAGSNRRLQQTQHQVDEVVDIMRVNVDKVLERDQKLSELDDRADALQAGASQFETSAAKLKRKYWWKNCKMWAILIAVVVIIIIIIIVLSVPK